MADKTGIEWTDATWNPLRGCSRVSQGCVNCYAETIAARFSDPGAPYHGIAERGRAGSKWTGKVELVEHNIDQPLRWQKPRRIFVNSMSDLFHEAVPDEWIDRIFAVMAAAHWHSFQVLTKRPERMQKYLANEPRTAQQWIDASFKMVKCSNPLRQVGWSWAQEDMAWPLPNIWLGVSVENQQTANERIPLLLKTPAAKRFISAEPLLEGVSLRCIPWTSDRGFVDALTGETQHAETRAIDPDRFPDTNRLDWVICGGESGRDARPMHPCWARAIRDQCAATGVPFFFKQWGEWAPEEISGPMLKWHHDLDVNSEELHGWPWDEKSNSWRVGKKRAGAMLDGREHKDFPE